MKEKIYSLVPNFIQNALVSIYNLQAYRVRYGGKWLYNKKDFVVFKNSVHVDKFKFPENLENIENLKNNLGISNNDFVIGLVARFSSTKNHSFLIEVFSAYQKLNVNSKLLLVGDGELRLEIEQQINEHNLQEKVIFTGNVSNPQNYLSLMNIFVMTSFNEGMPVVLIEAQCNGLPILMTDTLPEEIELTDLTYRQNLRDGAEKWAEKIEFIRNEYLSYSRFPFAQLIKDSGYDVNENTLKLIDYYTSQLDKK